MKHLDKPLATKFGPLTVVQFQKGRRVVASVFCAPTTIRMQLSGRFCESGTEFVEQSTLAGALDRLTLLFRRQRAKSRRTVRSGGT